MSDANFYSINERRNHVRGCVLWVFSNSCLPWFREIAYCLSGAKMILEDQKRIIEVYNSSAKKYADRCYHELDYKPLDRLLLDRFSELIPPNGLICDIGCGPGEIADYLHKKEIRVIGIDIADKMIEEAQRLNPNIQFRVDNMLYLAIPDSYFSGICSFYAIVNYDYDTVIDILREYYRVLKKNGILFLTFHAEEKIVHTDDFFESGKSLDFYYFESDRIIRFLQETGFEIREALIRYPYTEEYPSKRAYIICEKQ